MLSPEIAVELVSESLTLVMLLVAMLVGPGLIVGLIVSLFQALGGGWVIPDEIAAEGGRPRPVRVQGERK